MKTRRTPLVGLLLLVLAAGCQSTRSNGPAARTATVHAPPGSVQSPHDPAHAATLPLIAIVTTGGTIAMKHDPAAGGATPALSGEQLIEAVPELATIADLRVVPVANIDSRNMTPALWLRQAHVIHEQLADPRVAGVVVTHGTDTMEDSVWFVDLTLQSDKPVVFTGAMRSASSRDADGPRNLLNAVRQAVSPDARGRGATITFNGAIFAAKRVTKAHTNHVGPFTADDRGRIGEIDDEKVVWFSRPERPLRLPIPDELPRVELVYCYPGADGSLIEDAVRRGAAGIVVVGYGIGNVNEAVFEAIKAARQRDVQIVLCTRVRGGRVYPAYGGDGGGESLRRLGVVFGGDLLPWKARVLLMLALPTTRDPARLQRYFDP